MRYVGKRLKWWGAALASAGALWGCDSGDGGLAAQVSRYDYPDTVAVHCPAGARQSVVPDGPQAAGKLKYQVRTPANYDARFAHPLLVVYSYAGASAGRTERFTKLTAAATAKGFVVAYANSLPMNKPNVLTLGGVVASVADQWCIDAERVYYSGHSDGGTVSTGLSLLPETKAAVHGIAVSGAGFREQDLQELTCRTPIPVMVMHGAKDTLFPGWGRETSRWWASCNQCDGEPAEPDASGCRAYRGCAKGAPVVYCEGPQAHSEWPELQTRIVDFFAAQHGADAPSAPMAPAASGAPASSSAPASVAAR